ncbi:MAG: hypothetical protein ABSG78_01270 [Verrucomicrobiota bacterium]
MIVGDLQRDVSIGVQQIKHIAHRLPNPIKAADGEIEAALHGGIGQRVGVARPSIGCQILPNVQPIGCRGYFRLQHIGGQRRPIGQVHRPDLQRIEEIAQAQLQVNLPRPIGEKPVWIPPERRAPAAAEPVGVHRLIQQIRVRREKVRRPRQSPRLVRHHQRRPRLPKANAECKMQNAEWQKQPQ